MSARGAVAGVASAGLCALVLGLDVAPLVVALVLAALPLLVLLCINQRAKVCRWYLPQLSSTQTSAGYKRAAIQASCACSIGSETLLQHVCVSSGSLFVAVVVVAC